MQRLNWRKSSRSGTNGGDCVEVADTRSVIFVRDSKDPDGPLLTFDRTAWATFVNELKR
jgi:hypothetical protein